jgi:hypothetical protein
MSSQSRLVRSGQVRSGRVRSGQVSTGTGQSSCPEVPVKVQVQKKVEL